MVGYWHSKDSITSQTEAEAIVSGFNSRGMHIDVLVLDSQYKSCDACTAFNTATFPDPKGMVDKFKRNGTHVMAHINIEQNFSHPTFVGGADFLANKWITMQRSSNGNLVPLCRSGGGHLLPGQPMPADDHNNNTCRYDPFIPDARAALWRSVNATLVAAGVHMFWLDGNEIIGEDPWETPTAPLGPQIWAGDAGVPSRTVHASVLTPPPAAPVKCGTVGEGSTLTLGGCKAGSTIDQIGFSSYGTPSGNCDTGFTAWSSCNDVNSTVVAKTLCVGKSVCQLSASNGQFGGPDPCPNVAKHLSVLVHCSGDPPLPPPPPPPPPATLNCSSTGRNCPTEFSAGMNDEVGTFFPYMHQLTFAEGIERERLPPPAMMLSRATTAGSWRLGGASWDGDHHCEWSDYINHLCASSPVFRFIRLWCLHQLVRSI